MVFAAGLRGQQINILHFSLFAAVKVAVDLFRPVLVNGFSGFERGETMHA